ncbi:hypothetical protein V8G54_035495 [Vigna mungo]|uniref:NB-ARC domain-containing protein n=1 Tax=Vigna mungo TaxID=3915 RepID=A0AAQ3RD96_VIGMU
MLWMKRKKRKRAIMSIISVDEDEDEMSERCTTSFSPTLLYSVASLAEIFYSYQRRYLKEESQLQYSFCFNSFVKELEKEEYNLIQTIRNVEDRVIHVRRQTLKTSEVIDKWLENANIDSEYVNRLLRETNAKKGCFSGYCPNWIWQYRIGKKLAIKKADLQKIIQEGRQYIQLERIASIPSNTFDILTEKCMNFDSRKSAFDQLVKALKDDGVAMIGLYGWGVVKIAEAEHLFDKVTFVPVSSTVEVPRIQEKIASSLQYKFPENQEMERAQRLCMRLTQEKKILMILDDVWEKLDFGSIGIPSSEYHKGCKILITTRLEEVCISMDCQKNIYLPILTDEEARTLFQNKALISKDTPENIKHLAISISKECKGLPVAIVAVASSLKGKQEVIWRAALNKLKSSKPINIRKGLRDPYKCLKLSYDNLDDEEAKSLFLLSSAFPEDYEISVECLIRCAIGLGVAGEVDTYEEARTEVTATKIKLVSSCLMMEANDECVKMHDLVRDVAHWIANNENKIIKYEVEKDVSLEEGSIRYLWCVKFPYGMDCSNLEFLNIQTNLEVSDEIFERMGKLRILIVTNENYDRLQLSTTSFKSLTNLRCLILQNWDLRDISFVRDMKKLQSLSFHGCSLPSFLDLQTDVAVTTLTNLKLLEFKSCDIESNIFEEIKRIPFLEELYIYKVYDYGNDRKEESVKFSNSFSVPQKLQRTLGIIYFDISNEVIKGLAKKAKELFVTNIEGGAKNMMPDIFEIEEGMNELKELRIHDCEEIVCLVDTSNHLSKVENIFSKLSYMEIMHMNHLKTLWHGCLRTNGCFEKLEYLFIKDCQQLTGLFMNIIVPTNDKTKKSEDKFTIGHSMQSKILQNLQKVELYNCKELKYVFSASITGGLTQLKELHIINCKVLEQIIEDVVPRAHHEETNEIVEEDVQSTSGSFSLPGLAVLSIKYCQMLESLFTISIAKTLTSLEELDIVQCHGLKHLVTLARVKRNKKENMVEDEHEFKSDLSMFSSLKRVHIWGCDSLQDIFTTPFVGDVVNIQNYFPTQQTLRMSNAYNGGWMMGQQVSLKLESLKLFNLPKMTRIWVTTNNSFTLQHLNLLVIGECEKLEVIFSQSVLRCLPELDYLQVRKCEELRQIIEEDLEDKRLSKILSPQPCFPKLESLFIQQCHKLKCFTSLFASNDLSNLNILIIRGATELQEFIACEYDEIGKTKVELPQLKFIIFMHLSNFHQETIFSNVKHRFIHNCPKLSLTSTATPPELERNLRLEGLYSKYIESQMDEIKKLDEVSTSNSSTELSSSQINEKSDKRFTEKDYGPKELAHATSINSEVDEKSNREKFSQELVEEKSPTESYLTDQQNPLGETESTIKMSQQEWDPTPKNTSPFQMNREDPSTSEIKPCSSQVNDNNQSMLESRVEMVGHHNKIETKTQAPEIEEFQKIERKGEMTSEPQAIEQSFPVISSPNMAQHIDEIEANNIGKTTTSDKLAIPTSVSESIEEIGRERSRGGAATEGATIKTLSIGGDNISFVSSVTIHKSSAPNILPQDSQVVKQDNEMNEDKTEITPYKNIKKGLEKYKHFVDLNDSQISLLVEAIEAYPHLWNACEKFTDRFQAFMLKTLADMLLFLRSESVGSVTPEQKKEFLKLCDEAVQLGFEKSWVDEMRQRVVGRDPKLDYARTQMSELLNRHDHLTEELDSIKAPIGELVKRHDHLTQELHNMKKQLRSLNDFFYSPTKCFDFL